MIQEIENKKSKDLKTTILFACVQIVNVLGKAMTNKVAALVLGPYGLGTIGYITSIVGLIKTLASLGLQQSLITELSPAQSTGNKKVYSELISRINVLILMTSFCALIFSLLLIPINKTYEVVDLTTVQIFFVGLIASVTVYSESKLAVVKGMREIKSLAIINITSSLLSFIIATVLYFYFESNGIIPVLLISPLLYAILSIIIINKWGLVRYENSILGTLTSCSGMIKSGIILSITNSFSQLSVFITSSFVIFTSSVEVLGLYNIGIFLMVGYFSVIINALTTDYFPRISAVFDNNELINIELSKQGVISVILCFPIFTLFIFIIPELIEFLFSSSFVVATDFVKVGVVGTMITIFSNQIDLILVAKRSMKIYFACSVFIRILEIILNLLFFYWFGLIGLGYAMILVAISHYVVSYIIVREQYNIKYSNELICLIMFLFIMYGVCYFFVSEFSGTTLLILGIVVCGLSVLLSSFLLKKYMSINVFEYVKSKVRLK